MKVLTLKRAVSNIWGDFGLLSDGDSFLCATLERGWADNKPDISHIPAKKYLCKRGVWPTKGETFEITGVIDRFAILFHKGNFLTDSLGCVLLGSGYSMINNQLAITNSGEAFAWFMKHLAGIDEFEVDIQDP